VSAWEERKEHGKEKFVGKNEVLKRGAHRVEDFRMTYLLHV
jgi:hypothetical protein